MESIESYDGGEEYIAENSASNISSKSYYERADVNYQTGAGLGDDILLIAAVLCGITAIGLTARKCMHKNKDCHTLALYTNNILVTKERI